MAAADDIATAITTTSTVLKTLTATAQPDITINGESINLASLVTTLSTALPLLLRAQQDIQGPFQRITKMRT